MIALPTGISRVTARFVDSRMEDAYHQYTLSGHSDKDRYMLYAAVAVYILYGFLDLLTLTNATFLILTFRIFCAIAAILIIRFSKTPLGKRHFQLLAGTLMVVAGFSISLMIWLEGSVVSPPYYVGLIVVAMVLTGLIRVSFAYTLSILVILFSSFMLATLNMPLDVDRIAATFFVSSSYALAGLSNYLLEFSRRNEFIKHRERDMLYLKLEGMVEEANLSLKRKNAILNILTHVFRTPLHQIIGYAQILEQEALGKQQHPEYVEYSSHIHSAGQNLLRLVQRLMKYGRLEAGTLKLTMQKVTLNELVDCALSGASPKATSKNINVEYEKQNASFHVDPILMADALFEILDNAIEAAPENSTVTIYALENATSTSILVTDEGAGIDSEQLDNVRNSMELTEEFLGVSEKMSLGITLTERIISLHYGKLNIRRGPESGTVVEMILPNKPATPTLEAPSASTALPAEDAKNELCEKMTA